MLSLSSREYGNGLPIILIHGFPMNKKVWDDFVPRISSKFKIYTVDLPGFGDSAVPTSFSMQDVGKEILNWMDQKNIPKCIVIGHSLGGYVTLSMVDQSPERFAAFGLFHSTASADSTEKKESRNKVVEFVQKNGARAFTTGFIPPLFANKNHRAIDRVKEISAEASADAVIGYTKAMRDRLDTTALLKKFHGPVLFIAGKEDPGIPVESIEKQSELCQQPEVHILADVGHMGMIEDAETTARIISVFCEKAF